MKDYTEFPDLAGVYLEDSYALGITETPDSLAFTLEAVLTPDHPNYHEPKPGEKYCYVNANLTIGATEMRSAR